MFLQHLPTRNSQIGITIFSMTDFCFSVAPAKLQQKETVTWSNGLINSPAVFSLLEKRVLYFLSLQIKYRFIDKGLDAPEAWKDLCFELTDRDLGVIGGKTHVLQTYEALSELGEKFMPVSYYNEKKQLIHGRVHWVDTFMYNTETKRYEVRMSPELMPYLINLARSFTTFCAQTALSLRSKYSQKLYEFCCEFSGNYRYPRAKSYDLAFKKNVFPIRIEHLRYLLDLSEKRDERTGKILSKEKYSNFANLMKYAIYPAQKELYALYHQGNSEVWFDCVPYQKEGRKIVSLLLIIYTKKHPKEGLQKLWEEGDEPLNPFEEFTGAALVQKEKQASCSCPASQELVSQVEKKLETYLESHEVVYYLNYIQTKVGGTYDAYNQVLQVLKDKEKQKKFQQGTRTYQRTSIMHYALQENLKEFGWNIPELKRRTFCSA